MRFFCDPLKKESFTRNFEQCSRKGGKKKDPRLLRRCGWIRPCRFPGFLPRGCHGQSLTGEVLTREFDCQVESSVPQASDPLWCFFFLGGWKSKGNHRSRARRMARLLWGCLRVLLWFTSKTHSCPKGLIWASWSYRPIIFPRIRFLVVFLLFWGSLCFPRKPGKNLCFWLGSEFRTKRATRPILTKGSGPWVRLGTRRKALGCIVSWCGCVSK